MGYTVFCVIYLGLEAIFSRNANVISPSPIDTSIPYMEWTLWIYLSHFVLVFLAAWKMENTEIISQTFYSMALASLTTFFIFLVFPTRISEYPRGDGVVGQVIFTALSSMGRANCFPSLHVSIASLASYGLFRSSKRFSKLYLIWPVLIWISTLTTKQHFFVDVVGGVLMAVISFRLSRLLLASAEQEKAGLSIEDPHSLAKD